LLLLAVSKRDSHIVRGIAGANSHQNAVLVVGVRGLDSVTDVAGVSHSFQQPRRTILVEYRAIGYR
jgi:hypothetical protein